jgi:REP element-mobilizing transposase RayT
MRSRSRRPVQLSLATRGSGRGGYRAGAGRPRKREGEHKGHRPRAALTSRYPVHVTLKLRPDRENLRRGRCFRVLRQCFARGKDRFGFRLGHFTAQSNHLHLICEAPDAAALARGMQGLAIRIARGLNRVAKRRGPVFAERYHARILRSPTETRAALVYVYQNSRRHTSAGAQDPDWVDPCTSAAWFTGWRVPIRDMRLRPEGEPPVAPARSWLLATGWMRSRGPIDSSETPAVARSPAGPHGTRVGEARPHRWR